MAMFMYMVAVVFFQAGETFTVGRASVNIHQNARAAYDLMLRDLASAQLCSYETKQGYFSLAWVPDEGADDPEAVPAVQALAFTTLAAQPGAKPLVPGVSPQVALVEYTLEWSGTSAMIENEATGEEEEVRLYNLVKRVRFPQLTYYFCDMGAFPGEDDANQNYIVPDETVISEPIARGVYDMHLRIFHGGSMEGATQRDAYYIEVLDAGRVTGGTAATFSNDDRNWPTDLENDLDLAFRLTGGRGAPDFGADADSAANGATTLTRSGSWSIEPPSDGQTNYRIERLTGSFGGAGTPPPYPGNDAPIWMQLPDRTDLVPTTAGLTYEDANMYPAIVIERLGDMDGLCDPMAEEDFRLPYLVEVTLKMADPDGKSSKDFTFTQRFDIPSAGK